MKNSIIFLSVDVTRAGEGQLEIMVNDGNLRNSVDMERTGVYRITFTPQEAGRQYVNINFNSEGVPGRHMFFNFKETSYDGFIACCWVPIFGVIEVMPDQEINEVQVLLRRGEHEVSAYKIMFQ